MILRLALGAEGVARGSLGWLGAVLLLVALVKPGVCLDRLAFLSGPQGQVLRSTAVLVGPGVDDLPSVGGELRLGNFRTRALHAAAALRGRERPRRWMLANPLELLKIDGYEDCRSVSVLRDHRHTWLGDGLRVSRQSTWIYWIAC